MVTPGWRCMWENTLTDICPLNSAHRPSSARYACHAPCACRRTSDSSIPMPAHAGKRAAACCTVPPSCTAHALTACVYSAILEAEKEEEQLHTSAARAMYACASYPRVCHAGLMGTRWGHLCGRSLAPASFSCTPHRTAPPLIYGGRLISCSAAHAACPSISCCMWAAWPFLLGAGLLVPLCCALCRTYSIM